MSRVIIISIYIGSNRERRGATGEAILHIQAPTMATRPARLSAPAVAAILVAALALCAATASAANVTTTTATAPSGGCYSHLFTFGNSLIDTGNFIHYSTSPGPVARSPYGETFFRRPTGRWSDGRLIVDFIGNANHP